MTKSLSHDPGPSHSRRAGGESGTHSEGRSRLRFHPWNWLPALLVVVLLFGAVVVARELRSKAAPASFANGITIGAPDTATILGWRELGQHPGPRSASADHLLVERRNGGWEIANHSGDRRVLVRTDRDDSRYLQRWPLAAGDRIVLADAAFAVTFAGDARLTLEDIDSGRAVTWDDGLLIPAGEPVHQVCQSALTRSVAKVRWALRNAASDQRELALFSVGGGLNCSNRWKQPGLSPNALDVVWDAGRFWLAPGARRFDVRMSREGGPELAFADIGLPVDGEDGRVTHVILGRTVYGIAADVSHLTLTPLVNIDLWLGERPEGSYTQLAWAGGGADPSSWLRAQRWWLLPGGLAAALLGVALARYWSRRRYVSVWAIVGSFAALAPALAGGWLTLLLVIRATPQPDVMLRVGIAWLAWAWASMVLLVRGRLAGVGGWIWCAAVFLALAGIIVQLQLGAGAENTRWMSFVSKQAVLLALAGWGIAALAVLPGAALRAAWLRALTSEVLAVALGVLLVVLMLGQLAAGSEEGIAGLQPVELAKSVFVLLLAFVGMHFTEIRRRDARVYRRSPIAFLLPFLRFIAIFGLAVLSLVVGVRDFSPMTILGLVTLAWVWKVGGRQGEATRAWLWWSLRPAVVLMGVLLIGAGAIARSNPGALPDTMPQRERVTVWAEPELHPHSGAQVLAAMEAAGSGGWYGAASEVRWFGPNGAVMDLPALEDDFALAFLLHRFGAVPGLVLLGFQLLYVVALFSLGRGIAAFTAGGDFREQHAGLVAGYALCGLAWMQIAHWTIAWGNTLGLLPVMGQPMTWLSAGNSHLLGFGLLTLVVALTTAWVRQAGRQG